MRSPQACTNSLVLYVNVQHELIEAMLTREKALRLDPISQQAYAEIRIWNQSIYYTVWMQRQVCREFGLPDDAVLLLQSAQTLFADGTWCVRDGFVVDGHRQ